MKGVGPSIEKAWRYKPEELIGRPIQELGIITPESLERAFSHIGRVLTGERIPSAEYEFIAKDGNIRVGEVSGTPIWREGKIRGLVSVARDITERKEAEEALRTAQAKYHPSLSDRHGHSGCYARPSGDGGIEVTQRFAGKKLAGFVQKPYTISDFVEVLRKGLD